MKDIELEIATLWLADREGLEERILEWVTQRERDMRAENERLRAEVEHMRPIFDDYPRVHEVREALADEVERLRAQVAKHHTPGFVCQA